MDPHTPVVVSVGQVDQRDVEADAIRSPVGLFVGVACLAGDEARGLLTAIGGFGR